MELVRSKVGQLENQHLQMKNESAQPLSTAAFVNPAC